MASVEEIDARGAPDALLLAIHEIEAACSPERPHRSAELSLAYYRHWPTGVQRRFVARLDDKIEGAAVLMLPSPTFVMAALFVRPGSRRRGLGTALLEALKNAAREENATSFFADHFDGSGAAFARAVGAVDAQREVASEVRLREVEIPEPVVPPGWRLVSWRGATPDELIESYARARNAVDDAPTPGGMEMGVTDAAWVRAMEETAVARGREIRATVAVDERGEVGAFTDVRVSPPPSAIATTDDSATVAWARRQGLATALKRESLRLLQVERPDVEVVRTVNAEENIGMRAVNTGVGFVPTYIRTATIVTL
jgi:GNAT superfamily N-acetyltransferase